MFSKFSEQFLYIYFPHLPKKGMTLTAKYNTLELTNGPITVENLKYNTSDIHINTKGVFHE